MTQHPNLFAALAAPFSGDDVKQIVDRDGRPILKQGHPVRYITARTVMNRLDTVVGPENWWDRYIPGENSVLCELTVRLPDGSTLTKCDAGGYAGMADSGDDDKSGYSDAFKRTAVKFGVARYLYRDGVPAFGPAPAPQPQPNGHGHANEWPGKGRGTAGVGMSAEAEAEAIVAARAAERSDPNYRGRRRHADGPETGKALFAWTKEQEQRHGVGLLKYLNGWLKLQDLPTRMVDLSPEQVRLAHAEAVRKLQSIESADNDAHEEALSQ